jgi:periplasmic divalent cation tolerance protein
MSGVAILVTTIYGAAAAKTMARAVLEARLAACVQIFPIFSHFRWKGDMCESEEFQLHMKLRAEDYEALAALVRRLHTYETPEILRLDVAQADPGYAEWLFDATWRDPESRRQG